jgi:hypothetical protein
MKSSSATYGLGPATTKWATRYEELRRQVLQEPDRGGWGRTLLLRRGLVAWMQAWPAEDNETRDETAAKPPDSSSATALPAGLLEDLTQVLVNMIFEQRKECVS